MAHTPAAHEETFNELDPHGFEGHGQHASHVIVGPFTLRTILAFLLLFTVLTVATAQLETAIMGWFNIELPWWINVAVAMTIAVIKALLVMGYFMQLKYDNPINTVLMLFTFGALAIFLFFTGLDLFSRGAVDPQKQAQIIAGGTGSGVSAKPNQPVTAAARERFMEKLLAKHDNDKVAAEMEFAKIEAEMTGGHGPTHHVPEVSNPNRTIRRTGTTGALLETAPASNDGHGHPTGDHGHAPAAAPKPSH
jgi:cytochrome c oxidase subunit 4